MIDSKQHAEQQYKDFSKWCRDNPAFDLDPRLHTHSGRIGEGGYISHRTTSAAFSAWKASRQALEGCPNDWEMIGALHGALSNASAVPDAEYIRALQDAFDIIQADANTEQNYGFLCRIGSVLANLKRVYSTETGQAMAISTFADAWKS